MVDLRTSRVFGLIVCSNKVEKKNSFQIFVVSNFLDSGNNRIWEQSLLRYAGTAFVGHDSRLLLIIVSLKINEVCNE